MAKEKAAQAANDKGRSRTFYMTDEEYGRLTAQAERNRRTRSGQLVHLVIAEDQRDDSSAA